MASQATQGLRVAVEGCGHGTLNAIYASIGQTCKLNNWDGVDLLIIGGDFQAVRNAADLNCMAVPVKYREIGDFHEYYSGARKAPYLTLFVGGNHEASNHLWELYYGGWVAPNIYYVGAANVLRLGPLRIAGLSGIWKGYNYKKPHYERLPYNKDDIRSIYHVRELDTRKLLQIRTQVDIGISHDWPRGIEWLGDWKTLFRKKNHFEEDARAGNLGSVAAKLALDHLRPANWFSAHLHIKYAATVRHIEEQNGKPKVGASSLISNQANPVLNEEEIKLDMEGDGSEAVTSNQQDVNQNQDEIDLHDDIADSSGPSTEIPTSNNNNVQKVDDEIRAQLPASFSRPEPVESLPDPPTSINNNVTRFLALDKCLPRREFLQILTIDPTSTPTESRSGPPYRLSYDPEWLAITRTFAKIHSLHLGADPTSKPTTDLDRGRARYLPLIQAEEDWVRENITEKTLLEVPENFELTAPVYDPSLGVHTAEMPREYTNPQTEAFCQMIGVENPFAATEEERDGRLQKGPRGEADRGDRGGRDRGRGGFWRGRGGRGRGNGRGFRGRR